ncbi:MAG: DegV family protein [Lachnospiraceae bacterium]|nr:DegV family protein [Lachnospiraceae bacterium]
MKIKISSDSTCDLSKEYIEAHDIGILALVVVKDGESYKDGIDITPDVIFEHVNGGGALCSTSAANVNDYMELFEEYKKEYDAVIHISLGSGFSSSHQNACIAAEEFENVYVVDSMNLSTGHGLVVVEAVKMVEAGMAPEEIYKALKELAPRVEASFVLDRLDYMVKGGRCSAVAALGASLLQLKPCIEVVDGKMGVCKKYRGSYAKALGNYVKDRLMDRDDIDTERIFVTHTETPQDVVDSVKAAVKEYKDFEIMEETVAGCTVSCHCGPNTLGVLFIRK